MNGLFQRLKQRKLVQWAIAYVAAAFALLQGLDIVANRFELPSQTIRLVILAMIVGFFVTLILAWYHGERGAQRVSGTELLTIGLVLAIGGMLLWRSSTILPAKMTRITSANEQSVSAPTAIPEKSIAVLPFQNLSDEKANAYFAEGVQEEILTRLAKVADLKVISRTSTQRFQSSPSDLPAIAKQLGVLHILEGSVQKSGDAVRVNVQLVNALTDAHLWAEIYDRKLTDIFAVESEIAKTVAETLQAKLTGSEQRAISVRPTENSQAYQLYLQARFFWNKRNAPDLRRSIDYFNQAIANDPKFALAFAGLAQAWLVLPGYNGGAPAECSVKAGEAAKNALALDETSSDAMAVLAAFKALYEFDFSGAVKEYERVIRLNPNDATAHHWFAEDVLANVGQHERELMEMKRALELDPLSLIISTNLGVAYLHNGLLDEAIAQLRRTIEMDGTFYFTELQYGIAMELQGKIAEAIEHYEKAVSLTDDAIVLGTLGHIYAVAGRRADAQAILERGYASHAHNATPPLTRWRWSIWG